MMKKHFLILIFLLIPLCSALAATTAAAPDALIPATDTLLLLQQGDFPLQAKPAPGSGELMLYRSQADRIGAEQAIRAGLLALSDRIELSEYRLTTEDLRAILQDLINSAPELFHVNKKYSYNTYNTSGLVANLLPTYTCTPEEYAERAALYESRLNEMLSLHDPSRTAVETVIFYHDYLAQSFSYDSTEPFNYDVYSFFTEGVGVCQAYTLAFNALMNRLSIPVAFAQSEEMVHIWNLVELDGEWYHLDVTWDDPLPDDPGQAHHTLLLLSDAAIGAESMEESRHYAWTAQNGITCTSSRFDNAPWHSITTALVTEAASPVVFYGLDRTSGSILAFDLNASTVSAPLFTITDDWHAASGGLYARKFSGLALIDGLLYCNTPTSVLCLDPKTCLTTEFFPLPAITAGQSLFGLFREGNRIVCLLAAEFGAAQGRTELTPLNPSVPIHLFDSTGFLGSFESFSRAVAALPDAASAYTIALYPSRAGEVVPFNLSGIPENACAGLTIRPLFDTAEPITLALGSTATIACDLHLHAIRLISSAASASLAIGNHTLTLSGNASFGAENSPIALTGEERSALILDAEQTALTFTGSAFVDQISLRGSFTLSGNLSAGRLLLPAAAEIRFPASGSSLSANEVSGANELSLLPLSTCSRPPRISFSGTADLLVRYSYSSAFAHLPLLTAPLLPLSDLQIIATFSDTQVDLTPLFAADSQGTISRVMDSKMTIEDGRLISYLSAIPGDSVIIPASVTTIAAYAFGSCPNVHSVLIPETVTTIEPYGIGYLSQSGMPILSPTLVLRAEEHSTAAIYASGNSLPCQIYHTETEGLFTYRHYPELALAELLAWHGTTGVLLIPESITAADGSICRTTIAADLTAGRSQLTIYSPFPRSSPDCPYESTWQTAHRFYARDEWFTLTLVMGDTILRSLPLPKNTSPEDELVLPAAPDEEGVRYLFLGWDTDNDGIADEIPSALTENLTLHALFAPIAADQHLISWYDYDGTLIAMQALTEGSIILPPPSPTRPDTISHRYAFLAWSGFTEGMSATETASFVAVYEETTRSYTYSFLDWDGALLHSVTAPYGSPIQLPENPARASDELYRYAFSLWMGYEKNMTLTGDVSFLALYVKTDLTAPHPTEITSSRYLIDFGYLAKISPETTASILLSYLNEAEFIIITDALGNAVAPDAFIGTGMTVTLLDADGITPLRSLTTVVTGDTSGDGMLTLTDFVQVKAHLLEITTLSGAQLESADLTDDDTVSLTDFIRMKSILLGRLPLPA